MKPKNRLLKEIKDILFYANWTEHYFVDGEEVSNSGFESKYAMKEIKKAFKKYKIKIIE